MRFRFHYTSFLRLRPLRQTLGSSTAIPSLPPPPTLPSLPLIQKARFSGSHWNLPLWQASRAFSSEGRKGGGNRGSEDDNGSWKFDGDDVVDVAGLFGKLGDTTAEGIDSNGEDPSAKRDLFRAIDGEEEHSKGVPISDVGDDWKTAEGYKPWGFDEDEGKRDPFKFDEDQAEFDSFRVDDELETDKAEQLEQLEKEEQELVATLKGQNRAFGDLISASGITEEMIDSLILLKDLEGVKGLPSLREIEDMKLAKDDAPSTRFEMERKKQEEVAKARVRQVDEKGRSYGTGRRKCSSARVWIEPGDGKFFVNDKQIDVYFPIIDHRANLLGPFAATKTLGLFDVKCTVKGGGVSGQVGAIRLGISRALQNFEPGLRENLRSSGFLSRDSRIVERKKPGKAKARKSFQWVKR